MTRWGAGVDPAWVVLLAGVVAALQVGKLPPALPVLQDTLGVSLVQAGFLLSLVQLAGMLLGLFVGLSADGVGLRRSMLLGLGLLGLCSTLGLVARDPADLLALRAVEGTGFLLASLPAPSLIRRLVPPDRLSRALGWWGAYMPIGTALALLAGPLVMDWAGWRLWWAGLGALALGMAAWVWWRVPSDAVWEHSTSTRDRGMSGASAVQVATGAPGRLHRTLAAPGPWLVAGCFAVYSGQWLAVVGFLPSIYTRAGISGSMLGGLTALAAAVNMLGNIASGRLLAAGVGPTRLMNWGYLAMLTGAFIAFGPLFEPMPTLRYGGVLVFSALGGLVPGTLFSLAVRLAPAPDTVSTTVGWMQQWSSFGQFAGPPVVAWVAGMAGGWQWTWLATGISALTGIGLTAIIGRRLRRTPRIE